MYWIRSANRNAEVRVSSAAIVTTVKEVLDKVQGWYLAKSRTKPLAGALERLHAARNAPIYRGLTLGHHETLAIS